MMVPPYVVVDYIFGGQYSMATPFDELIIVFWVEPGRDKMAFTPELSAFANKMLDSRYYEIGAKNPRQCVIIDEISYMMRYVNAWAPNRLAFQRGVEPAQPTVWFGFQGAPGWTDPDFHDILNKVTAIPAWYPGVKVEWLPDNWFDHPGLTPPDMGVSETLAWLEQQVSSEPIEPIIYDFKGVHLDNPPF